MNEKERHKFVLSEIHRYKAALEKGRKLKRFAIKVAGREIGIYFETDERIAHICLLFLVIRVRY